MLSTLMKTFWPTLLTVKTIPNPVQLLKLQKLFNMSFAPFDTTVMLNFEIFTCQQDFIPMILMIFNNYDVGFTNVVEAMGSGTESQKFMNDHNMEVVILNMIIIQTGILMALCIQECRLQG